MAGPSARRRHTLGEWHRENTIMSAARTVRFSDEPQIFTPTAAGKQGLSRRQRRNKADAQRKAEATLREEEQQFTLQELAAEMKRFASGDSNGFVTDSADDSFSPTCFCSDCVDIIAAYFENENLAKHVLGMEDSSPVYMKDVRKLAASFLDSQKLRFYDQVTVEAFNDRAMVKGGAGCATPLSKACLANDGRFEKIAGKEMVCAILSTGVIFSCENGFKSHEQLLKENVDSNTIRSGCSCLKSDKWLTRRAAAEKKMQTTLLEKESHEEEEEEENENEEEEEQEADREREEFRPGNIANITSSCLGLCRHDFSCVVNSTNKARVLHSLMLVPVPESKKGGIASTTSGQYFSVVAHPSNSLIFSLGVTVYEAFAYPYRYRYWSTCRENEGTPAAKVYTTVQTVAAPFFGNVLTPHVDHQNPYGRYRTFRICLPGFSGRYNDPSIGWRSELYFNLTFHAAEFEGRGGRKSHCPFFEDDEFVAWPRQKQIKVEGGVFYDESGDLAGNYLGEKSGDALQGTSAAVTAYKSLKNLSVTLKFINECIAELLMGPFKHRLVQLKMFNKAEAPRTTHETQRLEDEVRYFARIIENWESSGKMFYQDIESSKKYICAHVQGLTMAAAALSSE